MFIETPRKITLGGPLRACEISTLIDYCDRLHAEGQRTLRIDLSAITDCDRAGLNGLHLLTSDAVELVVHIDGLAWSQFMVMLSAEPISNINALCASIRALLVGTSKGPPKGTSEQKRNHARTRQRS